MKELRNKQGRISSECICVSNWKLHAEGKSSTLGKHWMINGHDTGPQDKYKPCNITEQLKTQKQFAEQLFAEQMKPRCQILEVLASASQFTFTL